MSYVKIYDAGELSPLTDVVLLSDHNNSLFEKEKLISNQAKRIAELEEQLKELAERECVLCRKKIKELEQALDMASDPALHPTCSDCDKCSAISILETTEPKWISVKDRLPNEEEQYELILVGYVRTDNTIKYVYEASFDYETKQFYTENDWGDKTFIEPDIWMVVPPPPTTEESSPIEKEDK